MITGSKTKILGTSSYLYTMSIYDDKGRVIQTRSTNITGGTDMMTMQYGWSGLPLIVVQKQQNAGSNAHTVVTVTQNHYDELSRLIKVEKKQSHSQLSSGVMSAYKTLSSLEYDALGQLKTKILAPEYYNNEGVETLAYDYNIRGWLLGTNRDYARDANNDHYFGFDLGYDKTNNNLIGGKTYAAAQYNGNISGTVWKSKGDGEKRKYDFSYDAVNRITGADFNQYTGAAFNKTANVDFSMTAMTYDANGNIKTMNQNGLKLNTSSPIDQLTYTYQSNSNKLSKVVDAANDNTSTLGDFKYDPLTKGSSDYTYDVNGNLTADANKNISSISYNHLNLPSVITVTGKGTISYTYDAAGNKQKKVTVDNTVTPSKTTTTTYLSGMVYENDVLQFIAHEEGRIRPVRDENNAITGFVYDYFIKDHLGNVRMVLTEEQKTDAYPAATMETAQASTEESLYANLNTTRSDKPASYPNDTYTNPNAKVARLKAATGSHKVGPSIVLKVMAGDKFNLRVSSWYKTSGITPGAPVNPLNDLLTTLINGVSRASAGKITGTELTSSGVLTPSVTDFLTNRSVITSKPKAFVNWILFDCLSRERSAFGKQFKLVESSSSAEQVGANEEFKIHTKSNLPINKNGYLYVYVSNETPNIDVFFDNLQVTHIRGPILEETHYYPFGLTMAGISSKAAGGIENKFGITSKEIQNKEFKDGSGLELYDFGARMQDPQIGRWHVVDPLVANYYWLTPYNYCNNNPIKFLDPNGMEFKDAVVDGKSGRYDIATLDNVTIMGRSRTSPADFVFRFANQGASRHAKLSLDRKDIYTQARMNGWSQQQMRDSWMNKGISEVALDGYELGYENEMNYRASQMVAVGALGAPILATTAPGLFAVSARMALPKIGLSIGIQSFFNGVSNVDYWDVTADGFTAPGLNAILNGFIDIKPFASGREFSSVGVNKSLSQFGIDAGATILGGVAGKATWAPLKPLMNNGLEASVFYLSTQSWISTATQGVTNILTNDK